MKRFFVTILLIMPLVIMAGEEKKQNTWEPFQFFIGKWTGTVDISPDSKTYTFTSENIENLPPGWKVRTIIKIEGENTFHERFELAGPGKDFACLITSRFTWKK